MSRCLVCEVAGRKTYLCLRYGCASDPNNERSQLAELLREIACARYLELEDPPLLRRAADLLDGDR